MKCIDILRINYASSTETFTTDCPGWSDCQNNPVRSFWIQASTNVSMFISLLTSYDAAHIYKQLINNFSLSCSAKGEE